MTGAKLTLPDSGGTALRDPRLVWIFVFAGLALVFFGCTLIVKGNTAQQGYVITVFLMSIAMFVTSGVLKVGDASVLIKAITGKG